MCECEYCPMAHSKPQPTLIEAIKTSIDGLNDILYHVRHNVPRTEREEFDHELQKSVMRPLPVSDEELQVLDDMHEIYSIIATLRQLEIRTIQQQLKYSLNGSKSSGEKAAQARAQENERRERETTEVSTDG